MLYLPINKQLWKRLFNAMRCVVIIITGISIWNMTDDCIPNESFPIVYHQGPTVASLTIIMQQLPQLFIEQIKKLNLPGGDILLDALAGSAPSVSVRPNAARPWLPEGADNPVPWLENARYLAERPVFTFMPELHQGRFYVQDASSMFIAEAIRQLTGDGKPVTYLDACAAPGGKTTAAIDALPDGSLVVANEYDRRRASILRENIIKWGTPSVIVTQGDTRLFSKLKQIFDIIAVDAPCSGEGMFRKEPEAVAQWTPSLVENCAATQREIISNLWNTLRPGGCLIYSTCTFNRLENEDTLAWAVDEFGAEPVELSVDPSWHILRSPISDAIPCYRFMPGVINGEGLFMGVLRKPGHSDSDKTIKKQKAPKQQKLTPSIEKASKWIGSPDEFDFTEKNDIITAFPRRHADTVRQLADRLNIIHHGITVATVKGRDIIPDHSLAMSLALNRKAFYETELSAEDALTYLRRDAISLPDDTPRGFILATYSGYPLGFLKNIGNRANNLYPLEWRILKK